MVVHVDVDPDKLAARSLVIGDVVMRLKIESAAWSKTVDANISGLETIVLKTVPEAGVVRLRDVALVQLGDDRSQGFARLDGGPAVLLVLRPAVGPVTPTAEAELQRQLTAVRGSLPAGVTLDEFTRPTGAVAGGSLTPTTGSSTPPSRMPLVWNALKVHSPSFRKSLPKCRA